MFDGFDPAAYEAEVRDKWGHTDAYKESARRTQRYGKPEWQEIRHEIDAIHHRLRDLMQQGAAANDPAVQAAVEDHRRHIDRWFYPCSTQMHHGLGEMYVADPRFTANLDKIASGFAQFLRDAIAAS
ncbi:MAG TPA: TipAS antibiotic-recognition domain-containing protein [Kofleriaceae bacterium]|nr:TipAS antibiotic-recognition domain-containing protein [Kofleriaceae bacterium]